MADLIGLTEDGLRHVVETVVSEVLDRTDERRAKINGRIGLTEPRAAAAIDVAPHVLRDCRLRDEIAATKVGKRWIYSREVLENFLNK